MYNYEKQLSQIQKTNVKRRNNKKNSKAIHIDYDKLADAIIKTNENNVKNKKIVEQEMGTKKAILKCKFSIFKIWFFKKEDAKQLNGISELLQTFNVFVLSIILLILYCMGFSMLFFGIYQIFNLSFVFNEIVSVTVTMLIGFIIVTLGSLVRVAMMEIENNNMELQLSMFNVLTYIITIVLSFLSIIVALK